MIRHIVHNRAKGGDEMVEIFPVGRPAGPGDVVDRDTFIQESTVRLADGQSVMISNPRIEGAELFHGHGLAGPLLGRRY